MSKFFGFVIVGCVVLALVLSAVYMLRDQIQTTQTLRDELSAAQTRLEQLSIEHRDTMDALNKAQKSREEIYERAREQEKRLHEVLGKTPFAEQLIPDDWRMCLQWGEDGNCEVPAPRNASGGHSDTGQGETQDSGRHGADNR